MDVPPATRPAVPSHAARRTPHAARGRRVGVAVAGVAAALAVATGLATPAAASPSAAASPAAPAAPAAPTAPTAPGLGAFTATSLLPIVGDVTGDGLPDQLTLGYVGAAARGRCAVSVAVAAPGGGTAATIVEPLPVQGDRAAPFTCPDLGTVSAGRGPTQARLAVTFESVSPYGAPSVQLFNRVSTSPNYVGGFDGQAQPSFIGSVDFDGDGRGDVYELTDQGEGFTAWLLRAGAGVRLYGTPFTASAQPTFARFNADPGTDVVVTWSFLVGSAGVVVVDGHTGDVRELAVSTDGTVADYVATVADVDGDGHLDVQVTTVPSDPLTPASSTLFRNESRGSDLSFVAAG